MDAYKAIVTKRDTRTYTDQRIPDEVLQRRDEGAVVLCIELRDQAGLGARVPLADQPAGGQEQRKRIIRALANEFMRARPEAPKPARTPPYSGARTAKWSKVEPHPVTPRAPAARVPCGP